MRIKKVTQERKEQIKKKTIEGKSRNKIYENKNTKEEKKWIEEMDSWETAGHAKRIWLRSHKRLIILNKKNS